MPLYLLSGILRGSCTVSKPLLPSDFFDAFSVEATVNLDNVEGRIVIVGVPGTFVCIIIDLRRT